MKSPSLVKTLKQGALANAGLNLEIAEERFQAEQEALQRLEIDEQAQESSGGA